MTRLDDLVDPALALVENEDEEPVGTAFRISPDGLFLTCHHVAAGARGGSLRMGRTKKHRIDGAEEESRLDLALLRCPSLAGPALPVEPATLEDQYWTKGYGWASESVRSAAPLGGPVQGTLEDLRYQGPGDVEYRLSGALVLGERSAFDHGLSGAPIMDPTKGVVVGVVTTRYRAGAKYDGFAVPLRAVERSQGPLAAALRENRRTVARYGAHLNAVGARAICGKHRETVVERMKANERAAPERHVVRQGVESAVTALLAGSKPVLVLTGPSGVGKTAELAHIAVARDGSQCMAVLLEAATLPAEPESLARGLSDVTLRQDGHVVSLDQLATALAEEGETLLLLVDALNEAPKPLRQGWSSWLGSTVSWISNLSNVRLVFTCRSEAWELLKDHLPKSMLHDGDPLAVGDFDYDEAATGLRLYGLDGRGLRPTDAHHPFLMRIYAEQAAEVGGGLKRLSILEAIDDYVQRKCRVIAARLEVRVARVRRMVEDVASTSGTGELRLPEETLEAACATLPALPDLLVDEHVLVPLDRSYRFAFDQAAEFLQARQVDPDQLVSGLLKSAEANGEGRVETPGPYVFAALELERKGDTDRLAGILDELIDFVSRTKRQDVFWIYPTFERLVQQLEKPDALLPQILRYAEAIVEGWPPQLGVLFAQDLGETRLSLSSRLQLLRILSRDQNYYGFRDKDWDDVRNGLVLSEEPFPALRAEFLRDPETAIPLLGDWLDDDHLLARHEATVSDVALVLLSLHAEEAPDAVFDLMARRERKAMDDPLWKLAQRRVELVPAQCARWLADRSDRALLNVITAAQAGLRATRDPQLRAALLDSVSRVRRAAPVSDIGRAAKHNAFLSQCEHEETALLVLGEMLEAIRDGTLPNFWPAVTALRLAEDRVLPEVLKLARERAELAGDIPWMLSTRELPEAAENELASVLEQANASGGLSSAEFARAVLQRLYNIADTSPAPELAALAKRMATHQDPSVRKEIEFYADGEPNGDADRHLRRELAELLRRGPEQDW